jgi:hypothetical protein
LILCIGAFGVGLNPVAADSHGTEDEVVAEFNATGTGGFVEVNSDNPNDPTIPLPTPEEVDQPITINGEIYADGTVRTTEVSFPTLGQEQLGLPLTVDIEAPEPFEGEIDRAEGQLYLNGSLTITVLDGVEISVSANLTSGQSNSLIGSASGLATDSANVTLVNNEYVIDETTGTVADSVFRFPSPEPGRNWFSLTLDMEIESETKTTKGTIQGTVVSPEGEPVTGATVTTSVGTEQTTTATDGSFQLDAPAGPNSVIATADSEDWVTTRESVTIPPNATVPVNIQLRQSLFEPVGINISEGGAAGDTIVVTGQVRNTGDRTGSQDVTLSVGDTSATETLELRPGQLRTVTLTWETNSDDAGNYEATLAAGDGAPITADVSVPAGPNFNVSLAAGSVASGETLTAEAIISNAGSMSGSQEVTISVANRSTTETVQLGPGEETKITLTWETSADAVGEHDVTVKTGDRTITESIRVREDVGENIDDEVDFIARSTGGYMSYGYNVYAAAEGSGLEFPDKSAGEEPAVIAGVIDEENNTWESTYTFFPEVTQEGITGQVRAPNGLHGQIDREEGVLTATGTFEVLIDRGVSFTFDVTMTTGPSGEITDAGNYTTVNDTFTTINFVSNEFAVADQTGNEIVDKALRLPSPDPSQNYMELGFEVEFVSSSENISNQRDIDNVSNGTTAENEVNESVRKTTADDGLGSELFMLGGGGSLLVLLFAGYVLVGRTRNRHPQQSDTPGDESDSTDTTDSPQKDNDESNSVASPNKHLTKAETSLELAKRTAAAGEYDEALEHGEDAITAAEDAREIARSQNTEQVTDTENTLKNAIELRENIRAERDACQNAVFQLDNSGETLDKAEAELDHGAPREALDTLDSVPSALDEASDYITDHDFTDLAERLDTLEARYERLKQEAEDALTNIPAEIPTTPRHSLSHDALEKHEVIGQGGNADVYRATAATDDGTVEFALKEPRMSGTLSTAVVDQMLDEAETWQQLDDHDHIVSVLDYGAEPLPWIGMEYMDAGDLGERAAEMDLAQRLWTAIAVTRAVRHAHTRGVAHLDLKPANVLFRAIPDAWDAPKVADWGLSKHLLDHSKSMEGLSPHYAAPEQFDADDYGSPDHVTDIYQLGAVFYDLFTGRPPFEGKPFEVMNQIQGGDPAPPSEVADVPAELDDVLLTALATEKAERYESVLYLRDDLQEVFDSL